MKKRKLLKVVSIVLTTVLVATSVLVYIDKTKANASNKVTNKPNTVNQQIKTAMNSMKKTSVKGKPNSKRYTMKMNGIKVTYTVTETSTGRKVVQTNDSNNEYTELVLNNNTLSATTGEIINGKYVSKKSDVTTIEELTKQAETEEQDNASNRVSCLGLGRRLWYEKETTNINIGKSRFGSDLERLAIDLNGLDQSLLNNIETYQNHINDSINYYQNAKSLFKKICLSLPFQAAYIYITGVLGINTISLSLAGASLGAALTSIICFVVIAVVLVIGLVGVMADLALIINSVNAILSGFKAEIAYNNIESLGRVY